MNRIAILAGAIAAATLFAAPSFAQMYGPPGSMPPGGGPSPGPGMQRGYGPPSAQDVDRDLGELHTRLALKPEQESTWQGFANAVRQQTRQMQSMRGSMLRPAATAPERLTQMARFEQQRAAGMAAVAQAMTKLYGTLDENQRAIVDEEFPAPSGPGMGGGGPPIR